MNDHLVEIRKRLGSWSYQRPEDHFTQNDPSRCKGQFGSLGKCVRGQVATTE